MRTKFRITASSRRRLTAAAAVSVLAFGAIVLARAHGASADQVLADATPLADEGPRAEVDTPELTGFVALTQGAILANGTRELFAELRLEARGVEGETRRRPVSLAVVLDTSGSMSGDKILQARRSVQALADRMRDEDRLAIVTYDTTARVLQPLAPIGAARETLGDTIERIGAFGGTNIPAGLELGVQALNGAPGDTIRRLVLISDGLDGSGQPLPSVAATVSTRANGGTTTSALGVGVDYDERWLTTIADSGRGNYEFLAQGGQLSGFLARELEQASTTVADRAAVSLGLPDGWRVADVYGGTWEAGRVPLGSLFVGERRRVTLRIEAPAGAPGSEHALPLGLSYVASTQNVDRNLSLGRLSVSVVGDEAQVVASRDVALHAEAVAQRVDVLQAQAIEAWREGRVEEAERIARGNEATLHRWRQQAPQAARMLDQRLEAVNDDLDNFGTLSAQSAEGRAYGLGANAARRSRVEAF